MIVYAAVHHTSFAAASEALKHLSGLTIPIKQVERVTERIGEERVFERDAETAAYFELPLPERKACPSGAIPPPVATIQMDGGRLQILDRSAEAEEEAPTADAPPALSSADEEESILAFAGGKPRIQKAEGSKGHWREDKVGVLMSMASPTHATDPCPQIPDTFVNPLRILKLLSELKPVTGATREAAEDASVDPREETPIHHDPPEILVRTVLATRASVGEFSPMLAAAAWRRGFYAAERRAFVADGQACNWTTWRQHFSSFEPVLDFIHALAYVFAAASAGREFSESWTDYEKWIQWLWAGETSRLIDAIAERHAAMGVATTEEPANSARSVVGTALGYLRKHQDKMKYAEYRRQGLPMTSTHVESMIKQINKRVKGTEKFWSEDGAEALLQLRADYLSETEPMEKFWARRSEQATGLNRNRRAA